VDPIAGLDIVEKRKLSAPAQIQIPIPCRLARSLVTVFSELSPPYRLTFIKICQPPKTQSLIHCVLRFSPEYTDQLC
jgi:hypothetical protein